MRFSKISKAFKDVPNEYVHTLHPVKSFQPLK